MPAHNPAHNPPAPPSLRERRRAAAAREILDAAEVHLTEHGPHALSLRAVARSLGMTVQALYHYFPSRDALVTALITKAYDDLADAVQTAVDTGGTEPDGSPLPGTVVAAEGYRRWALDNPERFQLLYGTPLRYYEAPQDGPTTQAVRRMAATFQRELFGGFTTEQLAAADVPPLSPALRAHLAQMPPDSTETAIPPAATALFLSAWGHLHGLVILQVFGHTDFLGDHEAEIFRMAMRNMLQETHARIPVLKP
ncbi:TetR/AcrR family transcriptional regulator [Streptomyces sp. GQFP]|uniref:TetR/AcrR family transcriptional regulator n=1 Tax=Streptomyces sp. GQFP TaxID=2907545 RepID=UPI001F2706B7|nr:TetR/AcrR family transcriptional regulator [Streptomyces sp. GQFP]UIX33057.1 TetR/AcrR family transcriptional regulator; helix-turn-helix transcriptional regulator [Streptomyces sp. GQFP]